MLSGVRIFLRKTRSVVPPRLTTSRPPLFGPEAPNELAWLPQLAQHKLQEATTPTNLKVIMLDEFDKFESVNDALRVRGRVQRITMEDWGQLSQLQPLTLQCVSGGGIRSALLMRFLCLGGGWRACLALQAGFLWYLFCCIS